MDGKMTCNFTSFQQCFSHIRTIEEVDNAVCNGALFTVEKILPQAGIKLCPLDL